MSGKTVEVSHTVSMTDRFRAGMRKSVMNSYSATDASATVADFRMRRCMECSGQVNSMPDCS